ncbi:MAG: hypothetical protein LBD59_08170 [Prevotellaceae bacterium]|jgi:hypothetical protein|nr:hypothetical protein [Prevotellaceae bacterium]
MPIKKIKKIMVQTTAANILLLWKGQGEVHKNQINHSKITVQTIALKGRHHQHRATPCDMYAVVERKVGAGRALPLRRIAPFQGLMYRGRIFTGRCPALMMQGRCPCAPQIFPSFGGAGEVPANLENLNKIKVQTTAANIHHSSLIIKVIHH